MDVCNLLLVKTRPIRLVQKTAPLVLAALTSTFVLIQQTPPPTVLQRATPPTLLLQVKGGPTGPQGPAGTPDLVVDATCTAAEAVDDLVYVDSTVGATPDVRKVDVDDAAKMPATGIIISKPTPTTAKVQFAGSVTLTGLTPGLYFVGTDSKLSTTPPGNPLAGARAIQIIGHAYSAVDLLIQPQTNLTRVIPS